MKLNKCLESLKPEFLTKFKNIEIKSIEYNSKKVKKNSIFIAIKGYNTDGHFFIDKAIKKGASVIIIEDIKHVDLIKNKNIIFIKLNNTRKSLSVLSANFFNNPSKKIEVFGITGTNGKTSISLILKTIFKNILNVNIGVLGTISNQIGNKIISSNVTTPESRDLQELLKLMINKKCKYCFMEVSSHSLFLDRVNNIVFKNAIFSNITHDHLDFHRRFSAYLNSKKKLLSLVDREGFIVINIDDINLKKIIKNIKTKKITYGIKYKSDFQAKNIDINLKGISYVLIYNKKKYFVKLNLIGDFNVYNSLAAIATAVSYGLDIDLVIKNIKKIKIKGRFQVLKSDKNFNIIIDYAHTPDGLLNILKTARKLTSKKIICVFGCGGNRDFKKRIIMGKIASKYSDFSIITADNPRNENNNKIMNMIEKGFKEENIINYLKIDNREIAISKAIYLAKKGDIVIIAGKGHEEYQIIGDKKYKFSDIKIAKKILKERI